MILTKEILLEIVEKSLVNAENLYQDGKLLQEKKRFARAYTLFQLSMEEVGKASLAFGYALKGHYQNPECQKKFKKEFSDHKFKTKKVTGIDFMVAMSLENPEAQRALLDNINEQARNISALNDRKNFSLYTSFFGGQIVAPDEMISEEIVTDIEFYALLRHQAAKQFYKLAITHFDKISDEFEKIDIAEMTQNAVDELKKIMFDDDGNYLLTSPPQG